jgi:arylamine N-acetyltransferase
MKEVADRVVELTGGLDIADVTDTRQDYERRPRDVAWRSSATWSGARWSCSPCSTSVGTSIAARKSRRSALANARSSARRRKARNIAARPHAAVLVQTEDAE